MLNATEEKILGKAATRLHRAQNEWAWRCQECGYKFRNASAAEKAAFGDDGCPKCGSSDVDESLPIQKEESEGLK